MLEVKGGAIHKSHHEVNIRTLKDSDDPNETPYAAMTTGFPLYKGSYLQFTHEPEAAPMGFHHNHGDKFIRYPTTQPHSGETNQAQYTQVIMGPNPLVIGL